ncbi:exopolysaccharide biosynthesis protein [Actibacterium pelagium]|uniref:Exopolysaccharide synthesis, ExoD n=1 Tax=Actibacterium pelagium TaxID=2029103 RepID=A0A917AF60_9RHOB|nr:exopolysaccharide biosynthesis protein [Actibacterium pelagium]GGE46390.1 hypothetical protein GCM10011517_12590 [Actibacterium pelagium]
MTPEDETEDQFSEVFDDLHSVAHETEATTLGELVDALGRRGTGPLLVILSAVLILPVGMVPGMPGLVAIVFVLIGIQLLFVQPKLWMPARLRRITIKTETLKSIVDRARPLRRKARLLLSERLTFIIDSRAFQLANALILLLTGCVIFFIGFVPGLPFVLSIHILLIGLGLTARDGVVMSLGLTAIAPAIWLVAKVLF